MPAWIAARLEALQGFGLQKLLPAVIIFVIGIFVIRLTMKLITTAMEKTKLEPTLIRLSRSLLRIILVVLLFLITASALGIDVTGVVALASVLTLAISLSVQNALTNIIGGFTLLSTKPFVSGDFVEIAGQSGTVSDVGLTYTKLSTPDNKLVSIPNSAVVAAEIVNYSTTGKRRVDITVWADGNVPIEAVRDALLEAARVPTVLEQPAPFAGAKGYGEKGIEYVLQVWTGADDYWITHFAVTQNIQSVFQARSITLGYPQLTVHQNP